MNQEILLQAVEDIRSSPLFPSVEEPTDVSCCAQLLDYACYISENNIKEQYIFSEPFQSHVTEKMS